VVTCACRDDREMLPDEPPSDDPVEDEPDPAPDRVVVEPPAVVTGPPPVSVCGAEAPEAEPVPAYVLAASHPKPRVPTRPSTATPYVTSEMRWSASVRWVARARGEVDMRRILRAVDYRNMRILTGAGPRHSCAPDESSLVHDRLGFGMPLADVLDRAWRSDRRYGSRGGSKSLGDGLDRVPLGVTEYVLPQDPNPRTRSVVMGQPVAYCLQRPDGETSVGALITLEMSVLRAGVAQLAERQPSKRRRPCAVLCA